jgi:hypothetical protein
VKLHEFTPDYHKAYNAAVDMARELSHDIALRAVTEYGRKGFTFKVACRNDSDYARAEIITPRDPHTGPVCKSAAAYDAHDPMYK